MRPERRRAVARNLVLIVSAASLAVCLMAPILYLLGRFGDREYKASLLAGSIGWFLCAAALTAAESRKPR